MAERLRHGQNYGNHVDTQLHSDWSIDAEIPSPGLVQLSKDDLMDRQNSPEEVLTIVLIVQKNWDCGSYC